MACWTEWDPLEEVIVGDCFLYKDLNWKLPPSAAAKFELILEETKEDLDNLADYISKLGVKVHRPKPKINNQDIQISNFNIKHATAPIVPRDQYLVYGETIYQTYTTMPDRYIDSLSYYDIFLDLYKQGHNWISQPPPELLNFAEGEDDWWWTNGENFYKNKYADKVLWHTASMLKYGDALLSHWGPGTELGLEWMRRNTPQGRIVVENNYGHIDHGFFNVDDETIICNARFWIPESLKHKRIIPTDRLGDNLHAHMHKFIKDFSATPGKLSDEWLDRWLTEWKGYVQKVSYDCNVLVIDPQNVLFIAHEPKVFKLLNSMGINCHVCTVRHGWYWEAGMHCLTLDIKRRGEKRKILL